MNLNATTHSPIQSPTNTTFSNPMENFINLNRLRLANLNTPIERVDQLRKLIPGGPEIFIKRDDLTGYLGGK